MGIFNTSQSLEEMSEKLNNCVNEEAKVGAIFINCKLQEKLFNEQNEYNRKQLRWSRIVALATVGLVIMTLGLVIATLLLLKAK